MSLKKKKTQEIEVPRLKYHHLFRSENRACMGQEMTLPAEPCLTEHHCIHSAPSPVRSGFTPHSIPYKEHIIDGNDGMTSLSQTSQGEHSRPEGTVPGSPGKQQCSPRDLFTQHTLSCLLTYLFKELRWAYRNSFK